VVDDTACIGVLVIDSNFHNTPFNNLKKSVSQIAVIKLTLLIVQSGINGFAPEFCLTK
jgi:hypothetical protein